MQVTRNEVKWDSWTCVCYLLGMQLHIMVINLGLSWACGVQATQGIVFKLLYQLLLQRLFYYSVRPTAFEWHMM